MHKVAGSIPVVPTSPAGLKKSVGFFFSPSESGATFFLFNIIDLSRRRAALLSLILRTAVAASRASAVGTPREGNRFPSRTFCFYLPAFTSDFSASAASTATTVSESGERPVKPAHDPENRVGQAAGRAFQHVLATAAPAVVSRRVVSGISAPAVGFGGIFKSIPCIDRAYAAISASAAGGGAFVTATAASVSAVVYPVGAPRTAFAGIVTASTSASIGHNRSVFVSCHCFFTFLSQSERSGFPALPLAPVYSPFSPLLLL